MKNRAVVLTISDRCARGEAKDVSGPAIVECLPELDAGLVHQAVVPDELEQIRAAVQAWLGRCEIILTTGGTGIAPEDVTPEAVAPLIDRHLPGFGEAMRLSAFPGVPYAIIGRGGAGIAQNTLVVWLPGSPRAIRECLEPLAPAIRHVAEFLRGRRPH